jgi:hypothetical protein
MSPSTRRLVLFAGLLLLLAWLPPRASSAQQESDDLIDEIMRMAQGLAGTDAGNFDPNTLCRQELPRVEKISGMKAKRSVRARLASRDEARAHVRAAIDEQLPPSRLRPMEAAWRALGLLEPNASLAAEIEKLYGNQAGGYYDPATATLVLLRDIPVMVQVPVVRHELVHALQDQNWNLKKWLGDATEDEDRGAAIQAVLEGHANDVMNRLSMGGLDLEALLEASPEIADLLGSSAASGSKMPGMDELKSLGLDGSLAAAMVPRGTPPALAAQMLFPYLIGSTFIASYRENHPEDPACTKLYQRPPRTTAEVIDPRLWEQGGMKVALTEPGRFLPGSDLLYHSSLGRLLSRVVLTGVGDPSAGDVSAGLWDAEYRDRNVALAGGWQGDRVAVYSRSAMRSGANVPDLWIVVWCSQWSSPEEAGLIARLLRQRLPGAEIVRRGQRIDAILAGPSRGQAEILELLSRWQ